MTEVTTLPTVGKPVRPVLALMTALIFLVVYVYRKRSVFEARGHLRTGSRVSVRVRFSPRSRHHSPAIAVMSALLIVLAVGLCSAPPAPRTSGRAQADAPVSSRGGFRVPVGAVLGATPQPVPILSRPVGPPSPDPILLATARLALTPTPRPTASPLEVRAATDRRDIGIFRVTAYSDSPFLNGTDGRGITKSGAKTHWGCVAVDPRVIPLGTRLLIENYEGTIFTALDTGGGIMGRWIDIWFPDDYAALQHGLRELAVSIVEGN